MLFVRGGSFHNPSVPLFYQMTFDQHNRRIDRLSVFNGCPQQVSLQSPDFEDVMADNHVLEMESLLAPIPGNDPAGTPVADEIRRKLDDLRREPDAFDLQAGGSDKRADWYGVINLAEDVLRRNSKDLLVAVRLTEALTKRQGYSGLAQGLTLLNSLFNECWDRLQPRPEPGDDDTVRIGPFRWMNDSTKGARFPVTVANIPLFKREETSYGYVNVTDTAKPAQREEFERVFGSLRDKELEEFKEVVYAVRASHAALQELSKSLDQRFGDNAPDFLSEENPDNLGRTLIGAVKYVDTLMKKSGLESSAGEEEGGGGNMDTANSSTGTISAANRASREGLYRQIEQVADALGKMEPHSPIPFLLRRVVKLGTLSFPDLMRELVRESSTIEEFDRLLGTKPPESS